jgi:hypothetical protein
MSNETDTCRNHILPQLKTASRICVTVVSFGNDIFVGVAVPVLSHCAELVEVEVEGLEG